jgi:hypothetical protein
MVWNNSATLFAFIIFIVTSSTNFGILVYFVGASNLSIDDPSSCTIILPSSNSNGNPFADFGLLGGTYSYASLNFSKIGCVATLSTCSSVAYKPSCVCCCCYKCCYKCWECFGLLVVSIQSSHTSPLKCRWFSPSRNLISCVMWRMSIKDASCSSKTSFLKQKKWLITLFWMNKALRIGIDHWTL